MQSIGKFSLWSHHANLNISTFQTEQNININSLKTRVSSSNLLLITSNFSGFVIKLFFWLTQRSGFTLPFQNRQKVCQRVTSGDIVCDADLMLRVILSVLFEIMKKVPAKRTTA